MIKIFVPSCKNPDFIRLQADSIRAQLVDDFEILVLNDGLDSNLVKEISEACIDAGVTCIDVPKDLIHSSASVAHCAVVQWAYDNIILEGCMDDIVVIMDSDMFMIKEFSFSEFVGNHSIGGLPQARGPITYYFTGLLILNMPILPNPSRLNQFCGIVRGHNVDAGGMLWHYVNENPGIMIKNIEHTSHIHSSNNNLDVLCDDVRSRYNENYRIEILQSSFLHYGGASTRNDPITQKEKREFLFWVVEESALGKIEMPEISYVFRG